MVFVAHSARLEVTNWRQNPHLLFPLSVEMATLATVESPTECLRLKTRGTLKSGLSVASGDEHEENQ
jgi:hypothetical protein